MCQSIAQGGRRCPAHRHDTRAVIALVQEREGGYSKSLYHAAFVDLRRSNRGLDLTPLTFNTSSRHVNGSIASFTEANDLHDVDHVTLAAQAQMIEGSVITPEVDEIIVACVNARTQRESRQVFSYVYDRVDNYPEPDSEAIDRARRNMGTEAWVRSDPRAVKALAIVQSGTLHETNLTFTPGENTSRRIETLIGVASSRSPVIAAGYDPQGPGHTSRLELVLRDNLDTTLAYQNVSEDQWESIRSGGSEAAETVRNIRLDDSCRYDSLEAAEAAANTDDTSGLSGRCGSCGQYVGESAHACPARVFNPLTLDLMINATSAENVEHEDISDETNYVYQSSDSLPPLMSIPSTPEENVYPSTEQLTSQLQYTRHQLPRTPDSLISHCSGTYAERLPSELRENLEAAGQIRDARDYVVSYPSLDPNTYAVTTQVASIIPHSSNTAVVVYGDSYYTRAGGLRLENGETWENHYGELPDGATPIGQNTTASSTFAPVPQTGKLFHESFSERPANEGLSLDSDKWKFGKKQEIKRGLDAGETIIVPFSHSFAGPLNDRGQSFIDSHGWEVSSDHLYSNGTTTSGRVALKKDANGVVKVVGVSSLHCRNCSNANCTHVGYSIRQASYIAQAMIAPTSSRPRVAAQSNMNETTGLPTSLNSHCSVSRDSEGNRTVTFEQINYSSRLVYNRARVAVPVETVSTSSLYRAETNAPNPTFIARALRNINPGEEVVVPVVTSFSALATADWDIGESVHYAYLTGSVTYTKDENNNVVVKTRSLRCDCPVYRRNYSCVHTRNIEAGEMSLINSVSAQEGIERANTSLLNQLSSSELRNWGNIAAIQNRESLAGRQLSEDEARELAVQELSGTREERIRRRREREEENARIGRENRVREELAAYAGYAAQREAMASRYAAFEGPKYSENYEAFEEEVKQVRAQIAAGEDPLTYVTINAMNGIGDDIEHGRKFGVELEVVFPNGNYDSKEDVARELAEAGLSDSRYVEQYHSGQESGWAKWTAEDDCTVDLEVVSPVMSDTPEGWAQLQQVCDIIKSHGGSVNQQTGSHVHISTGDYGSSVSSHAAMLDEFSRYSDIFYRLGSNPETKTHRGTRWCSPNVVGAGEHREAGGLDQHYGSVSSYLSSYHSSAINFEASGQGKKSHAEVRLWDGSLNPKVVQMQVMLTAAITEVASQRVDRTSEDSFVFSDSSQHMPLGSSKGKTFASEKEETAQFREMLDRYFPREDDRKRFIALWETTKWQTNDRRS